MISYRDLQDRNKIRTVRSGLVLSAPIQISEEITRIKCTGAFSLEGAVQIVEKLASLTGKSSKVLLDASQILYPDIPAMQRYVLAEKIAEQIGPKLKLAILFPREYITKFGENVAKNRGARLLVTSSEIIAKAWLEDPKS